MALNKTLDSVYIDIFTRAGHASIFAHKIEVPATRSTKNLKPTCTTTVKREQHHHDEQQLPLR